MNTKNFNRKSIWLAVSAIMMIAIGACDDHSTELNSRATVDNTIKSKTTSTNAFAATSSSIEYTDWSGKVKFRFFYNTSEPCQHCTGSVTVDPQYVLFGGAAWVEAWEQGAFLTESRPDFGLTTWYASSKDHLYPDSHTLNIIAIGIRLEGVTADQLRSYMTVRQSTTGSASHPNVTAALPAGYKLVGGGARVDYHGQGNHLVNSYPKAETWYAESKDHKVGDPAAITAYAIGINNVEIPNFGFLEFTLFGNGTTYTSSGYQIATRTITNGWALTCIGAKCDYFNKGRMLMGTKTDVGYPYNGFVYSFSKDHGVGDGGYTSVYASVIRKKP